MDSSIDPMNILELRIKVEPPDDDAGPSTSPALNYNAINDEEEEYGELSKICRLCGVVPSKPTTVLKIFDNECARKEISEKINKYLPIQVSMEDPLPKTICADCIALIENWDSLVKRTKVIEEQLKEKCGNDQRLPINKPTDTQENTNTNDEIVPIIENYTYIRDDMHGVFETPQFKAFVPLILLNWTYVEDRQSTWRWCFICDERFQREVFTTHVYTMHAEFKLHCEVCNTFVEKQEYVAHMSQHSYEKSIEKEKHAKKTTKKILDVNLAWFVRHEFCDCKNIMCTFNKELLYKICPTYRDYDCITETMAHMLNISLEKVRCAYEEHYMEHVSRRKKIVSLPTELNTIGTPRQIKIAGKISNRRLLNGLNNLVALKRQSDLHHYRIDCFKRRYGPDQNQLPGRPVRVYDANVQIKLELEDEFNNNSNTENNDDTNTPEVRRIERNRKCRFCDKVYTSSVDYFVHVRHAHKESQGLVAPSLPLPVFKCRDCNKRLRSKQSLLIHCRRHRGVKNFHCSSCDKSFRWRIHLDKHEKVHGPRTKYACPTCQKVFTVKSDLRKHQRKHIVKNFECTICKEKFTGDRYLKVHMTRKHKNENESGGKVLRKVKGIKSTTDVGTRQTGVQASRVSTRKK